VVSGTNTAGDASTFPAFLVLKHFFYGSSSILSIFLGLYNWLINSYFSLFI